MGLPPEDGFGPGPDAALTGPLPVVEGMTGEGCGGDIAGFRFVPPVTEGLLEKGGGGAIPSSWKRSK